MFKIEYPNGKVEYFDNVVYIKKHTNGCYIPCSPAEAEGVCLKIEATNKEGETFMQDTPYSFENASIANNFISYAKEIDQKTEMDELNEIISILAGGLSQ